MNEFAIVITTTDSDELSSAIANILLDKHLAACIQVNKIQSYFRWDGAVQNDVENLLLIKCKTADYELIEAAIKDVHTYDEPEIIQVPITNGSAGYLGWIKAETVE